MKQFPIVWSALALRQLDDIYEYIAIDSMTGAANVTTRVIETAQRLQLFPLSGQEEEALKELKKGHRYLVAGKYKVIYRLDGDIIYISAVFDTRQDPDKLKKMVK